MAELKKYSSLKAENPLNFGAYQFYKIPSILWSAYLVPKDNNGNVFYINNYINWDQSNWFNDPIWQIKGTRIANVILQKLTPTSKKAIEQRQKASKKIVQIKKAIIENRLAR